MLQFSKALRAPDEAWQAETGLMAALLHTKPLNDNLTSSAARHTLQPIRSRSLRISFVTSTSRRTPVPKATTERTVLPPAGTEQLTGAV